MLQSVGLDVSLVPDRGTFPRLANNEKIHSSSSSNLVHLGHQTLAPLSRPGRFRRLHSTFPLQNSWKELASANLGDEPDDSRGRAFWVSMSRYDRCTMECFISRSRAAELRRQLDIQGQAKTKQTRIALSNVMLASTPHRDGTKVARATV